MQQELRRYSIKVVADGSTQIQGRIGINTGEVVVRSIQTGAGQVEYTDPALGTRGRRRPSGSKCRKQ